MKTTKPNLHFLLALGGYKVVVLKQDKALHIYSNTQDIKKNRVRTERISQTLALR